jgi:hypothetical protein
MSVPASRRHNALKHAGFSAATILPGESAAEFEKLRQAVIAEFRPNGALEEDTIAWLAHLLWRKKNLVTFHLAERARQRVTEIQEAVISRPDLNPPTTDRLQDFDATFAEKERAAEAEARKELKELYRLVEIGEELDERLDGSRKIGRDDREMPEAPFADKRRQVVIASIQVRERLEGRERRVVIRASLCKL